MSDRLGPQAAHDDLSFSELAKRYNFGQAVSERSRLFTRLVLKECQVRSEPGRPLRVLDIGCGKGIELCVDYQWAIRRLADEFWGLEPDRNLVPSTGLFDHYRTDLMEQADLPGDFFDVAYSFMVMEHVSDPEGFLRALRLCLKPGGVYLFATPNKRHYFTRIASTLHALKLDELVLRAVRPGAVDAYHYPVQYRFNDERRINQCAQRAGFEPPEFVYVEEEGPIGYFPRPLRFLYHATMLKRRLVRNPRALITMIGRVRTPKV